MNPVDRISIHATSKPAEPNCLQRLLNLVWSVVQRILNFFCCVKETPPKICATELAPLPESFADVPKKVRCALSHLILMEQLDPDELDEEFHELAKTVPQRLQFSYDDWLSNYDLFHYFQMQLVRFPHLALISAGAFTPSDLQRIIPKHPWQDRDLLVSSVLLGRKKDHYGLLLIDRKARTVNFFDPKYNYGDYTSYSNSFIALAQTLSENEPTESAYTYVRAVTNQELQRNDFECTIWTCWFLDNYLAEEPVDYNALEGDEADALIADRRKKLRYNFIEDHIKTALALKTTKLFKGAKEGMLYMLNDHPTLNQARLSWAKKVRPLS